MRGTVRRNGRAVMDNREIADAINNAFQSDNSFALMVIAHALNVFDTREGALQYIKDSEIIK